MSNRRRRRTPAAIAAYARAYRCHDCPSYVGRPTLGPDGIWHVPIHHEDDCPVLAGTVSPLGATIAASAAVGGSVAIIAAGAP